MHSLPLTPELVHLLHDERRDALREHVRPRPRRPRRRLIAWAGRAGRHVWSDASWGAGMPHDAPAPVHRWARAVPAAAGPALARRAGTTGIETPLVAPGRRR